MKRILVDMSATLIHHGHVRILKAANEFGKVIVALTVDHEILKHKGFEPELCYSSREEIIKSIKYVDSVVPSPWLIEESFLNTHEIDFLVHGSDNSNPIPESRIIILPRTPGISSSHIRNRVLKIEHNKIITQLNKS
jgi:cytidyltransferase-like protein